MGRPLSLLTSAFVWIGAADAVGAEAVLLNEVLYRVSTGAGDDPGNEWIELCNVDTAEVDLTGWTIEVTSGGNWSTAYTFDSGTLASGDYLLVGGDSATHAATFSPNLPNASSTAGIRLVDDDGTTIDTLLYGTPNNYAYEDDDGDTARFADTVADDETLARLPDCADTNDSSVDWAEADESTAGTDNGAEEDTGTDTDTDEPDPGDTASSGECEAGSVLINEFMPDPSGSDAGYEWVELRNIGSSSVDLSGWELEWGTQSFSKSASVEDGLTLAAGGYLLIADESAASVFEAQGVSVDQVESLSMGNAGGNADGFRLVGCDGDVVDTVIYGTPNEDDWEDDSGAVASDDVLAPSPTEGLSLGRDEEAEDTDDSAVDFAAQDPSTPGSENGVIPDCDGQDDVKINEFLVDPDGSDDGLEWIELYSLGDETVDLSGWQIQWGTSSFSSSATLESGVSIDAGGFLLIGDASVAETFGVTVDVEAELSLGNASNGDGVRLVHCGGGAADTVIYGSDNEDSWSDDAGEEASSLAPEPESGMSLARCQDGVDTDLSAEDFVVPTSNTPGETNPECVPVECTVGSGTIKINELLSNPSGTDSGNEWIELYNAGSESQRLDDWIVETATKEWSEAYVFEGGVELAAGEFLLLGAEYVPGDYVASSLSLGNGGTAPDGVRLVDCEAVVQDTVLWGDDDAEVEDSLEDDLGDSSMGVAPEEDLSLGRYPDGEDSDDNAEDLYTNMTPTPGYENVTGSSSNVDDSAPQKGCGKSADGDGPSKCASVSAAIHLGWLAGLVVLARRRDGD